jgi:hypothetical protein
MAVIQSILKGSLGSLLTLEIECHSSKETLQSYINLSFHIIVDVPQEFRYAVTIYLLFFADIGSSS